MINPRNENAALAVFEALFKNVTRNENEEFKTIKIPVDSTRYILSAS